MCVATNLSNLHSSEQLAKWLVLSIAAAMELPVALEIFTFYKYADRVNSYLWYVFKPLCLVYDDRYYISLIEMLQLLHLAIIGINHHLYVFACKQKIWSELQLRWGYQI